MCSKYALRYAYAVITHSLDCKEIDTKGNHSWIFIGRTDAEAEAPVLWPHDAKSWLSGKAPDAGKDWGQEKKGITEDEMVGWHHCLKGPEFEKIPGDSEGRKVWCAAVHEITESSDWVTEQQQMGCWVELSRIDLSWLGLNWLVLHLLMDSN